MSFPLIASRAVIDEAKHPLLVAYIQLLENNEKYKQGLQRVHQEMENLGRPAPMAQRGLLFSHFGPFVDDTSDSEDGACVDDTSDSEDGA